MRFVELFAGIGGFSLGFERAGMECVGHVEIDNYAQKVLLKHWPDVPLMEDVKNVKGDEFPTARLLCGGPPCQSTSVAAAIQNKRTGNTLWPEMARIAEMGKFEWIVIEQPTGNSRWENKVEGDLESIGYSVTKFKRQASDFGAPHPRSRVFFIANSSGIRFNQEPWKRITSSIKEKSWTSPCRGAWRSTRTGYCRVDDGFSNWVDRLKCLGNALVPQIAEYIGNKIIKMEQKTKGF